MISVKFFYILTFRDVQQLVVNQLHWKLEYPEIQQTAHGFGDQISQPDFGSQISNNLSQMEVSDSQKNNMLRRYEATKPFVRFKADRARLVSARRHVIGFFD